MSRTGASVGGVADAINNSNFTSGEVVTFADSLDDDCGKVCLTFGFLGPFPSDPPPSAQHWSNEWPGFPHLGFKPWTADLAVLVRGRACSSVARVGEHWDRPYV